MTFYGNVASYAHNVMICLNIGISSDSTGCGQLLTYFSQTRHLAPYSAQKSSVFTNRPLGQCSHLAAQCLARDAFVRTNLPLLP